MRASTQATLPSGREAYVLCLASELPSARLAAATSRPAIELYDRRTLLPQSSLAAEARVNELTFASTLLYAASSDGLIRAWDPRTASPSPILSLVEKTGEEAWSVCAGGSHLVGGGLEGGVVVWDVRRAGEKLCRWEVHTEPVTQVRFPSGEGGSLFSASVDGLICQMDTSKTDDEEAVVGGAW